MCRQCKTKKAKTIFTIDENRISTRVKHSKYVSTKAATVDEHVLRGQMIKYRPFVRALIPPISTLQHIRVRYATFVRFKVLRAFTEQIETDSECLMLRHLTSLARSTPLFFRVRPSLCTLKFVCILSEQTILEAKLRAN